jgi:hypothetical protein
MNFKLLQKRFSFWISSLAIFDFSKASARIVKINPIKNPKHAGKLNAVNNHVPNNADKHEYRTKHIYTAGTQTKNLSQFVSLKFHNHKLSTMVL